MLITVGLCWAEAKLQHAAFHTVTEVCRDSPELTGQTVWKWLDIQYTLIMTQCHSPCETPGRTGEGLCLVIIYTSWILLRFELFYFTWTGFKLMEYNNSYAINPNFLRVIMFNLPLSSCWRMKFYGAVKLCLIILAVVSNIFANCLYKWG